MLRGLTLRIDNDERIAILGANGNGKSTLVKLLAGRLPPMSGQMTSAQRLEVAYFAQHQLDELNEDESAYTHLRRLLAGATEAGIRTRAAAIGFPDRLADTPAKELSGGEKARLLLGLATLCGPHLVILDEPTNHLDIDRRAALVAAINAYPGAVILVAHDRHLLDACADRLLLVADGQAAPFDGDLDDYRDFVLAQRNLDGRSADGKRKDDPKSSAAEAPVRRVDVRRAAAHKRVALAPLRRRIAAAEAEITRLQAQIKHIDAMLAQAELFASEPGKAVALAKMRAENVRVLAGAEEDWLTASAALEQETT